MVCLIFVASNKWFLTRYILNYNTLDPLYLPQDLGLVLNKFSQDHRSVKIQCLLADKKFHKLLEEIQYPNYDIVQGKSVKFGKFVYTSFTVLSKDKDDELGKFQSLQNKDELYVISGSKAEFFDKTVMQILRQLYPNILFGFIHSNGIYEILSHFENVMNIELKYKGAVRKQIFGLAPRTEREWEVFKEGRVYPTFHEAFQESRDDDLWIDSIKVFHGDDIKLPAIQFSISRKGLVSIDRGFFDSIFSNVIHLIYERSKERREQFKHRSRKEQTDKKPKPLIVRFGKDVFEKMETRKEFSEILEKYPHCNYSVMHSGNPHVYLSILDRNDNSSFSVRTYGEDSLLLIPQIKTSSLALMRFSEFLVSSFYEGVIQNFEQEEKPPAN